GLCACEPAANDEQRSCENGAKRSRVQAYLPRYGKLSSSAISYGRGPAKSTESSGLLVEFARLARVARVDDPRDRDAEEVERDHRRGEDRLVHRVAGRGDDRRDDVRDEDRILAVLPEEARRHQAQLREEEHDRRHLEDDPHAEEHFRVEAERVFEPRHEHQVGAVEAREEAHHERKRDVMVERRAGEEPDRREEHERRRHALLFRVQPGGDEAPDLVHHVGRRDHRGGDQRDRDVHPERFARLGVDHLDALREDGAGRRQQEVDDLLDEGEADEEADADSDAGAYDADPELLEVLQERHLGFAELFVLVRRKLLVRARLRAGERNQRHARAYALWSAVRTGSVCGAGAGAGAGGTAACATTVCLVCTSFCSSRRISSSSVLRSSLDAFLNSAMLLPSDLPSSGSFRGPKMIRAITKMMISSGIPIEPNIRPCFLKKVKPQYSPEVVAGL